MKTVIYSYNHSRFGFQNQVTVEATSEQEAFDKARKAVLETYGAMEMKRFTFKIA